MKAVKLIIAFGIAGLMSACANTQIASRNAQMNIAPEYDVNSSALAFAAQPDRASGLDQGIGALPPLHVQSIHVRVPKSLSVSEANGYLPKADIVWRGDPIGDRHAQIKQIFENGLGRGVADLQDGRPVSLHVDVIRFHSVTERTRAAIGGVHSIKFELSIVDNVSGALVRPARLVEADLKAFGGAAALAAEQQGETQKKRVTDHLAVVIQQELTQPGGHQNARLGWIQSLHKF